MKGMRIIWALTLLVLMISGMALAPQEKNPPAQNSYAYDQSRQQTINGLVAETKDYHCPVSGTVGSHITVKLDIGSIEVHLAPASFMKQYEIMIRKDDRVTIVGSKITYDGKPALIAKSVTVGRETFNFRDPKGLPLW